MVTLVGIGAKVQQHLEAAYVSGLDGSVYGRNALVRRRRTHVRTRLDEHVQQLRRAVLSSEQQRRLAIDGHVWVGAVPKAKTRAGYGVHAAGDEQRSEPTLERRVKSLVFRGEGLKLHHQLLVA